MVAFIEQNLSGGGLGSYTRSQANRPIYLHTKFLFLFCKEPLSSQVINRIQSDLWEGITGICKHRGRRVGEIITKQWKFGLRPVQALRFLPPKDTKNMKTEFLTYQTLGNYGHKAFLYCPVYITKVLCVDIN